MTADVKVSTMGIVKRVAAFAACALLSVTCIGCSTSESSSGSEDEGTTTEEEEEETVLDLTGTWVQVAADDDSWQEAEIDDDEITVYWVSDGGDTKSLYWAGTYEAPTDDVDEYTWTSENDTEQTSSALMASDSQTKDFTYSDGELTYEVTALGTTTTMTLERSEE